MLINNKKKIPYFFFLLVLLIVSIHNELNAQVVWESPKHPIHNFLARQAQKGYIDLPDFILPLSRKNIHDNLTILRDSAHKFTEVEKKELHFYRNLMLNSKGL